MTIQFLIATMNRVDDTFLERMFRNIGADISAVVVNQCTVVEPILTVSQKYPNIQFHSVRESGLARSRNRALALATADICVIADDDVIYSSDALKCIAQAFDSECVDVARLQIQTPEGEPYKKYALAPHTNTLRNALGVSSIEIVFRRNSVYNSGILFDERFGLGGRFKGSEDMIFISDCIKKGLQVRSVPLKFVIHPKESSGTDYRKENTALIVTIGAAFTRIFGKWNGLIAISLYVFKRFKYYRHAFTPLQFLQLLLQGRKDFYHG